MSLRWPRLLALLACLVAAYLLNQTSAIQATDGVFSRESFPSRAVKLPFFDGSHPEAYSFRLKTLVTRSPLSQRFVRITPDDCVRSLNVNGTPVSLSALPRESLCNVIGGFNFPLGDFLKKGENSVEFEIQNLGGDIGLRLSPSNADPLRLFIAAFSILILGLLTRDFLKTLPLTLPLRRALLTGVLLCLFMYFKISPTSYTYDVEGHLAYVDLIIKNGRLPPANACWQCYQPPLYYVIGAGVARVTDWISPSSRAEGLQFLAFIFFTTFLIFGVLTLKRLISEPQTLLSATLLFVFWPSGFLNSVRIGNDGLFYASFAAGFYFLLSWIQELKIRDLLLSSLFCLLTFVTKSSGLSIMGAFFVGYLYSRTKLPSSPLRGRTDVIWGATLALAFSWLGYVLFHGGIVGNAGQISGLLSIQNNLSHFLILDFKDFFETPFTNTFTDHGGRQYFWNFLIKTSLFGEFHDYGAITQIFANCLLLCFFGLTQFFLWQPLFWNKNPWHQKIAFTSGTMLTFVVWLFFLVAGNRLRYPFSCSGDFRYIYPVILPLCFLLATSVPPSPATERRLSTRLASFALTGFVLCSIGFALTA